MSDWIRDNIVHVIGWMAALAVFIFLVGRRFQRLEDVDNDLAKTVAALTKTVDALGAAVNGQNGNLALAKAVDSLASAIGEIAKRQGVVEDRLSTHDAHLGRMDEIVRSFNERTSMFYSQQWQPLIEKIETISETLSEHGRLLARIDERFNSAGNLVIGKNKRDY